MKKSTRIITSVIMFLMIFIQAGCGSKSTTSEPSDTDFAEQMQEASTTPYGKYPELVTYTLGKLTGSNNSNMPESDTYEDNAYTRFLRDFLNIQNKDVFEEADEQYDSSVTMAIQSGNMPDIMIVSDIDDVNMLVEYDMIEDLTQAYDNCMSERIKEIYAGYGDSIKDLITFDGKIMAIPETNIDDGPNLIWLRKDWMDKLGLAAPKNLSDVEYIIKQFIEKDPGENGPGNTVGLVCDPSLCGGCGYSSEYLLDIVFAAYGAFPKQWIEGKDGKAVYGSIQPETRTALEKIQKLYTDKLIDPEMLVRSDCQEPVLAGKVGIFFGPWWSGYTVSDATLAGEADWRAYFTPLSEDGNYYTHMPDPTSKYVVASKDCKNPEAAFKIVNYLIKYERDWIEQGLNTKTSSTDFYPLWNGYDNADEIEVSTETLEKYLAGEITMDDVDFSQHKLLKNDMEAVTELKKEPYDDFSLDKWNLDSDLAKSNLPRLVSLLVGGAPLVHDTYVPVYNAFSGQTETMETKWANLKKMEEETFAKIIMGKADISEFDTFVENWKKQGGDQILKEINEELGN